MNNFWKAYFALFKNRRWAKWMIGTSFVTSIVWGYFFGWKYGGVMLASYWVWSPVFFYLLDYKHRKPLDI